MKKLLLSTGLLGLLAVPALAQDQNIFRQAPEAMEIRATDFIGMRVYATEAPVQGNEVQGTQQDWQDIGEVGDLILSREGQVQAVLVDVGGFLGMGEHTVAVNMDALKFLSDSATADNPEDFFLVINTTKDALQNAPEYTGPQEGETAQQAAQQTDQAISQGATETAAATGAAAGAAAGAAQDAGQAVADTTQTTTTETQAEADQTAAAATDQTATDQTATTDQANAGTTATTDQTATSDQVTNTEQTSATATRTPITREGYVPAGAEDFTADRLQGAGVYDANDNRVGEVGEILLSADGQVSDLVIDVGGFLGIGEKPVALPIASVDILKEQGGDDLRVYVSQTEDELKAMPKYEKNG